MYIYCFNFVVNTIIKTKKSRNALFANKNQTNLTNYFYALVRFYLINFAIANRTPGKVNIMQNVGRKKVICFFFYVRTKIDVRLRWPSLVVVAVPNQSKYFDARQHFHIRRRIYEAL